MCPGSCSEPVSDMSGVGCLCVQSVVGADRWGRTCSVARQLLEAANGAVCGTFFFFVVGGIRAKQLASSGAVATIRNWGRSRTTKRANGWSSFAGSRDGTTVRATLRPNHGLERRRESNSCPWVRAAAAAAAGCSCRWGARCAAGARDGACDGSQRCACSWCASTGAKVVLGCCFSGAVARGRRCRRGRRDNSADGDDGVVDLVANSSADGINQLIFQLIQLALGGASFLF